ncbi:hypothetical protein RBSH_05515 [Rhodopirellula baltica SH28]|uniref:Uncharacterized protein n=1 Tax=Rhodopirellula baltica SH28 TaxID=993517 RepID=K5D9T1_RHOBT|nr:hypothetical protein RBSH_05515 [Rhodopirellula baltica SH28]
MKSVVSLSWRTTGKSLTVAVAFDRKHGKTNKDLTSHGCDG